jgi:hypothetical protein
MSARTSSELSPKAGLLALAHRAARAIAFPAPSASDASHWGLHELDARSAADPRLTEGLVGLGHWLDAMGARQAAFGSARRPSATAPWALAVWLADGGPRETPLGPEAEPVARAGLMMRKAATESPWRAFVGSRAQWPAVSAALPGLLPAEHRAAAPAMAKALASAAPVSDDAAREMADSLGIEQPRVARPARTRTPA